MSARKRSRRSAQSREVQPTQGVPHRHVVGEAQLAGEVARGFFAIDVQAIVLTRRVDPALPELAPTLGIRLIGPAHGRCAIRNRLAVPLDHGRRFDRGDLLGKLLDLVSENPAGDEIQDEAALLVVQRRVVQLAELLIGVHLEEMREGVVDRRRIERRLQSGPVEIVFEGDCAVEPLGVALENGKIQHAGKSFTDSTGLSIREDTPGASRMIPAVMRVEAIVRDPPLEQIPALAARLERLGFDGVAIPEIKRDPFVVGALVAATSTSLRISTAVALAFPRSPTVMAYSARTLHDLTGGRFALGLGTQVRGHIERRFGMSWSAPVERLRRIHWRRPGSLAELGHQRSPGVRW